MVSFRNVIVNTIHKGEKKNNGIRLVQLHGFHFMTLCKPGASADPVQTGALLQACSQRQNLKITNKCNNTYVCVYVCKIRGSTGCEN